MLEFNIDKQAGIQLHTCERKSRWCKIILWLSWLAMLAFLGWLFWKGLPGNIFAMSGSTNVTPANAVPPQLVQKRVADCKGESDAANKQQDKGCEQQLSELKSKLNHQFSKKYSQQVKSSGEKLKNAEMALAQAREKIIALEAKPLPKPAKPDSELQKKLFFYEKILGTNGVEDAVFINHFAAKAATEKGHYHFQLILARLGKHENTTGKYDIFLKGYKRVETKQKEKLADAKTSEKTILKKEPVTYKHTDLLPAEAVSGQNNFAFKYYQIVTGEFVLPGKFELESLSVNVQPEGMLSVRNNYDWDNLKQQKFKEFE